MPDISMCITPGCALSERCRRHEDSGTAPSFRQSWMEFGPPGDGCKDFWPVSDTQYAMPPYKYQKPEPKSGSTS